MTTGAGFGRIVGDFPLGVGGFSLAFLLHPSAITETASSLIDVGVGLAPPPSFQFATFDVHC